MHEIIVGSYSIFRKKDEFKCTGGDCVEPALYLNILTRPITGICKKHLKKQIKNTKAKVTYKLDEESVSLQEFVKTGGGGNA